MKIATYLAALVLLAACEPEADVQKQAIPVLLRGLAQKQPGQTSVDGVLDLLQNMVATKGQNGLLEFTPRPGTTALSTTTDSGSILSGFKLSTLGTTLIEQTGTQLYRRASDGWHLASANAQLASETDEIISTDGAQAYSADVAYVGGYRVAASTSLVSGGAFRRLVVVITDANGDRTIVNTRSNGSVMESVRIVVTGQYAVIFWVEGTTSLMAMRFDSLSPSALGSPVTVSTVNIRAIDVQVVSSSGTVACLYFKASTLTQRLLTVSTMTTGAEVGTGIAIGPTVAAYLENNFSSNVLYVPYVDPTTGLHVATFNGATLAPIADTVYDAAVKWAENIAGSRQGSAITVYVTTDIAGSFVPPTYIYDRRIVVSTGGAVSNVVRGMTLASRALVMNSTHYALVRYRGTGQGTYFLVDLGASSPGLFVALASALHDVGGVDDYERASVIPNLYPQTTTTWLTAGIKITALMSSSTGLRGYTAASVITFKLADTSIGRGVELNRVLHFPGGLPMMYDGTTFTELGFPIAPEQSDTPVLSAGGGLTANSTYLYRWVYAWPDAAGNIHRSAPSIVALQVSTGANGTATFLIPTLRATRKTGVVIETYRTLANGDGSVYYLVSSVTAPTANDPTADRVAFVDTVSDATAAGGEPLYTNGGILDNLAPPPCLMFAHHKGRLVAGGIGGDPQAIWFSKEVSPGFGVAFSDALVSRLRGTSDSVTAMQTMDAWLVVFTVRGSWATGDEYPDDAGLGGNLRFTEYSSATGCSGTGLLARNDSGLVVWAGSKFAWKTDRGISWSYVGADIEDDAATFTPVAAVAVNDQSQVRFIGSQGGTQAVFVYEAIFGTWSRWKYTAWSSAFVDVITLNGVVYYLRADGVVVNEAAGTYDDLGTPASVAHQIRVSNLNFAGVGGFQRLHMTRATGRVIGTGGMTMLSTQVLDAVNAVVKSHAIGVSETELDLAVDPATYGKCSSFEVKFTDTGNGANTAFTLAAITCLVSLKGGLQREPPARRMT